MLLIIISYQILNMSNRPQFARAADYLLKTLLNKVEMGNQKRPNQPRPSQELQLFDSRWYLWGAFCRYIAVMELIVIVFI